MSSLKKKFDKKIKKIRRAWGIAPTGYLSGGTLAQYKEKEAAEDEYNDMIKAQEAALQAQYDAIVSAEGADSIAAQERKKQIELLKKRRKRSGTILTSPLGLTGEPTTTSPTLLGGS